jgi:hypothetical protein
MNLLRDEQQGDDRKDAFHEVGSWRGFGQITTDVWS